VKNKHGKECEYTRMLQRVYSTGQMVIVTPLPAIRVN